MGAARAVVVEMAVEVAVGAGREATEAVAGMEGMAGEAVGSTERGPMAPFDAASTHTHTGFLTLCRRGGSVAAGALGGNRWVGQALMNPSNPDPTRRGAKREGARGGLPLILINTNRKLRSHSDNWKANRERRDAVERKNPGTYTRN